MHAVPIYPHPISFIVNILHESGSFVLTNEPVLIHFYYLNFMVHSDFLSVHLMSLFCSRISSLMAHYILSSRLLGLLLAVAVSQASLEFGGFESFEDC